MLRQGFKNQNDQLLMAISVLAFVWALGLALSTGVKAVSAFASLSQFSTAEAAGETEKTAQVQKIARFVPDPAVNQQPAAVVEAVIPDTPDVTVPKTNGLGNAKTKTNPTPVAPAVVAADQAKKPAADPAYKASEVIPGAADCDRPLWIGGTVKEKSGNPIAGVRVRIGWKKYYADRAYGSYGDGSASVKTDANGNWKVETPLVNASYHLTEFSAAVVSEDGVKQFSPITVFTLNGSCRNTASATIDFVKQ